MNALLENMLISVLTGLVAAGGAFQTLPASAPLDQRTIVGIIVAGVLGFAGCAINGLRQKEKPTTTTTKD